MKKNYKYKAKDYRRRLNKYWKRLGVAEDVFNGILAQIEKDMAKETGIKDIEFFRNDDGIVGIGNASRTMELIPRY